MRTGGALAAPPGRRLEHSGRERDHRAQALTERRHVAVVCGGANAGPEVASTQSKGVRLMPVMTAPSPTLESLATGLAGAIGCSYRRGHNDLIFVEFGGKLSKLNLVRPVLATVSSGTATLHGTWTFDLDTGTEGTAGGDIWWEQ